ncbi:MAG: LytTR family DNA-binding domain-containing protein [Lachnospiraceae bacterium]|nr:LytTR family DNA-binding domain-containing protein [Lachnospiraceae bacterium]
MKININVDESFSALEVNINCSELSEDVERIISAIRMSSKQLVVKNTQSDEDVILDAREIAYAEAIDRKCFIYTKNNVYETSYKLYELEALFSGMKFCRVSKSCLVSLKFISSIKTELNHRLRLTLKNGEAIIVSRQYADNIKEQLGVKKNG